MTDCGLNQTSSRVAHGRHGFTLVELLIVIGIIGVLVGLLLPAVSRVRIAGQKVATQSTISRISFACDAYYSDHAAYPGPFADAQLVSTDMTSPTVAPHLILGDPASPALMYADSTVTPAINGPFPHAPTTSENLFLGLCGGLRVSTTVGGVTTFIYDAALAKRAAGPGGLSQAVAKHSQSYMELGDADISSSLTTRNPLNADRADISDGWWWPGAANGGEVLTPLFVGDSPIYEFMDRFAKPMPILYMRAMRGVTKIAKPGVADMDNQTGFIYDWTNAATKNATDPFQYRADQIEYAYSNFGRKRDDGTSRAGKAWRVDTILVPAAPIDPAMPATGANIKFAAGDQRYFVNEQISTGDPSNTTPGPSSLVPQQKDKYILISAGPDGTYGTADDIRN